MRMHCLLLIALLAAAGCAEPMPVDSATVLSPGRDMRLAFRFEMQDDGVAVMEESSTTISSSGAEPRTTVTKREETPYSSIVWADMELPLSVTAIPGSNSLRVTMTVHRLRTGGSHTEKGKTKHKESVGFEVDAPILPEPEWWSYLRNAEFVAVIDTQKRLASTDVTGKYWADIKKKLAEPVWRGGSYAFMALRRQTGGVFMALEDAMAYLPPKGVQAGQSWKMRREHVLPYHAYAFWMITHGCLYSKEEATCTVQSIKARGLHSIATIAIRGKRIPHSPKRSMPPRVKYFDLKGELEVNLNTRAIEKLRLESAPTWVRPEEDANLKIKLVQVITLKPA